MAWLPQKTVVVPIDFSGTSVEAVGTALELVDSPSDVHVLHVVMPLDNMSSGMNWGAIDDRSREEAVEEHFGEFLKTHGFTGVTTVVRVGDPGLEIACTELSMPLEAGAGVRTWFAESGPWWFELTDTDWWPVIASLRRNEP